ncbi:putative Streptogrisin-D [Streptomyces aurantiacus JA 4570]|uniref:Putative Streptogrisin-D n=1 Tax=Streptomyces aurantiacus JA 4570 TaxID=1286094 RepID=S3ZUR9_9ACTN|nr:putative Streptogrisin-D [Streptomyces aurantiacus JA 4570]
MAITALVSTAFTFQHAEAAGTGARVADQSTLAELKDARAEFDRRSSTPGTSWVISPAAGKLVVTADRTVRGAELRELKAVVEDLGDKARLTYTKGEFKRHIAGGDGVYDASGYCSLGFNVVDQDGNPYFLTAGHCTNESADWSETEGGPPIGTTADSSYPGDDYGIVEYTADVPHPSAVNLYNGTTRPISDAADPYIGQYVHRSGATTGLHDGQVTNLDAAVDYGDGPVYGLIETDVCAEPGDSGGSLFAGETALGLTSGGTGDCASGGTTYFQPVTEPLAVYGVSIG